MSKTKSQCLEELKGRKVKLRRGSYIPLRIAEVFDADDMEIFSTKGTHLVGVIVTIGGTENKYWIASDRLCYLNNKPIK